MENEELLGTPLPIARGIGTHSRDDKEEPSLEN